MRYHVYQFSDKTDNFDPNLFWPKFAKKIIFGLEIQKTNTEKEISILKIPCVSILRQNGQL